MRHEIRSKGMKSQSLQNKNKAQKKKKKKKEFQAKRTVQRS